MREPTPYFRPATLVEALAIRAETAVTVLAGGTDIYPAKTQRNGWGDMRQEAILDISAIPDLRAITVENGTIRIGALTTWADLRKHELPSAFAGYKAASREIGGVQIQNRGTLVGNLCTASPAGDGIPCLLTLDAEIELASIRGRRRLPAGEFLTGYRQTGCASDELVTAILVPEPDPNARSRFVKLGARRYLVISIVMAAAVIVLDERDIVTQAKIAVGACSAIARRLAMLEQALVGLPIAGAARVVAPEHLAVLAPIDDIRASAAFRRHATLNLLRDLLAGFAPGRERRAA